MSQSASNPLATQPVGRLIMKFSVPGIISQMVNSLHNLVDQIFVGMKIGDLGIGATNIAFPLSTITTALSVLFGAGGASKFSLLLGAGKPQEAKRVLGNALFLLLVCGVTVALLGSMFLTPMLYLFGVTDLILPYALPYARLICLGLPFGVFSAGMSYFIRADGSPGFASITLLSGAAFNMVFDPIFLYGFNMGMEGVALATILGQLLSSLLALYYLLRKFQTVHLTPRDLLPRLPVVGSICSLGAAAFTTHLLGTLVQIIQMNALRHYGALSLYGSEVALTAAGAVSKIMMLFMACVIGIALGCQPIYGFNFGAKRYDRVKQTYLLAIRAGTLVAVLSYLLLQLFPRQILSILGSEDPLFYDFATRYIRIFMAALFLNALQPITSNFFTAIGKANLGFWLALARQGLVLIPLLLLLPRIYGVDGIFFAGPVADTVAAVLVVLCAIGQLRRLDALAAQQNKEVSHET